MARAVVVIGSVMVVLAVGCASPQRIREHQERFVATAPTCSTERECELKWAAARNWILTVSSTKLQHMTPDFMETYNSPNTAAPSYRVVKDPMPGGGYRFLVTVGCRNPFGCIPDPWEAAQHFNNYVNSVAVAPPGPAPPAAPATTGYRPAPDWCKDENVRWLGDRCVEKK